MDIESGTSPEAGMTTGAVALRLGVAPTTLRSWDHRYGLGPAAREGGRHRRWAPDDVALLERMCRLTAHGVAPAEAARLARRPDGPQHGQATPGHDTRSGRVVPIPAPRTAARAGRGLGRAAVRLDSPRLDTLLAASVTEHGLAGAWEVVMSPTLRAIGRTWAESGDTAGERYVEAEHLLSWHISTALRGGCRPKDPESDEPPVLLACVPGETHTLAMEALAASLGERGRPVRMFGAAVPAGALSEAVRRTGPRAVVLWSQTRLTADRVLVNLVRATAWGIRGARFRPTVLIAGPGWTRMRETAGVRRPRSLAQALDFIEAANDG
ncbi:MerR family transcriptional regulator [Streptomyces sp. H27-C3]|uniref:MerR family transcriptional regulator n=1 Tax=Streptomyces sp. H27-C3 TaxID=3046305 RepID=UPI0024BB236C|nr:MerR family transcriptional regulator [Streptomyces sp. H27-C3]MDJ0460186.1 MerR family transcriptional regulator [Streptomyces sp. H27-C3]